MINELEKSKKLMSIVKKTQSAAEIYETLTSHFVQMTGNSLMQLIVQLIGLARHDPRDNGSGRAIVKLRELQHEFVQREIMFQPILYISYRYSLCRWGQDHC